MEIFVVFKTYRQNNGEYFAVEVEKAFSKKEDAEQFVKDKPVRWWETKPTKMETGEIMPIEYLGIRSVHPAILDNA